ncbi:MAG: hypothetical protein FWB98_09020, partial [Defluviitaleaceae bacterium]|nr:hypothetical protein [Defluviitaleaceae bacterium]
MAKSWAYLAMCFLMLFVGWFYRLFSTLPRCISSFVAVLSDCRHSAPAAAARDVSPIHDIAPAATFLSE